MVTSKVSQYIEVPSLPWLKEALNGGFCRGGVYLIAGAPGLGKTTLINQALGDIAGHGRKVLYISTEQSLSEFQASVERLHGAGRILKNGIAENFYVDDSVDDLELLPRFFNRKLLTAGNEYHEVEVVAVDSIQGSGLSANSTRKYRALYEFANMARAQGLVVILVGHTTKAGGIAGPQNLQHNVDCVLHLRRAFRLRPLFVPKNRYGPDLVDPIMLTMDSQGRLVRSALSTTKRSTVYGFSGTGDELSEAQASINVPKYGCRAELLAAFLPEKRIRQLLAILNTLPEIDLSALSYQISCYLPGQQRYREELDLPLSIALLSCYLQQPVPPGTLFVGELDLATRIRAPEACYLRNLAGALLGNQNLNINRVFVSKEAAPRLRRFQQDKQGPCLGQKIEVHGVENLQDAIGALWPSVMIDSIPPAGVASAEPSHPGASKLAS